MGLGHSPSIVTSGLALHLDAGNVKSYPGSGSTFTDMSGNGNNFTLNGSPSFNYIGGGNLTFGGSQYLTSSFTPSNTWSISMWFNNTSTYNIHNRGLFSTYGTSNFNGCYVGTTTAAANSMRVWYNSNGYSLINYSFDVNSWYQLTITCNGTTLTVYINGVPVNSISTATTHANTLAVGQTRFDNNYWIGNIANTLVYSRELSASEVLQNYSASRGRFSTPTVSSAGLKLLLDTGNASSYPGSGSNWYDLSGNGNNATLYSSPTFNSSNSGSLVFNGSSQYASVPYSSTLDTPLGCFYELWCYPTMVSGYGEVISRGTSDSGASPDNPRIAISSSNTVYFDWSTPSNDRYGDLSGITLNAWNCIGLSAIPSAPLKLYINGVYRGQSSIGGSLPASIPNTANPIEIARVGWLSRYYTGRISVVRVYNRYLSDLEAARNFEALRGRFGL